MRRFKVSGMTCDSCVNAVVRAIKATDRSASVKIDLASGETAVVTQTDTPSVIAAIRAAGFDVERIEDH